MEQSHHEVHLAAVLALSIIPDDLQQMGVFMELNSRFPEHLLFHISLKVETESLIAL